jgi:hypothetical protein
MEIKDCLHATVPTKKTNVEPPDDTRVNMDQPWNDGESGNLRTLRKPVPAPICQEYTHMDCPWHDSRPP